MAVTDQPTVSIYGLADPRTGECRYVGKSKHMTQRGYEHLCASQLAPRTHRNYWIKSLLKIGLRPEMFELESIVEDEWQEAEQFWIEYMWFLGARLTNGTAGGDGNHNPSPKVREKMGASFRGKKRIFSPEHIAKIAAANRAKAKDPVWRAKMSKAMMGNTNGNH